MPRRALLISNPRSRLGDDPALQDAIQRLQQAGLTLTHLQPDSRKATGEAILAQANQTDCVIVAGGDGTLNACVTAVYEAQLPLAILPRGTANDLARSLDIPDDLHAACRIILDDHRRRVDLGWVNGHLFFNAANIGLGTRITHALNADIKKTWGVFGYLRALISAWKRNRVFRADIRIDGQHHRLRSIQLAVGNGRYYGGGNVVEASNTIEDGLLALYSLAPQSWLELLTLAPRLREGEHDRARGSFSASGRTIEVRTSRRMEVHADGEPLTHTPAQFKVLQGALEIIAPVAMNGGVVPARGDEHAIAAQRPTSRTA